MPAGSVSIASLATVKVPSEKIVNTVEKSAIGSSNFHAPTKSLVASEGDPEIRTV